MTGAKKARLALRNKAKVSPKATKEMILVNVHVRIRGSEALAVLARMGRNFHFHQQSETKQYKEGVIAVLLQSNRTRLLRDEQPGDQIELLLGMQSMIETLPRVEVLDVPVVAVVKDNLKPIYVINEVVMKTLLAA